MVFWKIGCIVSEIKVKKFGKNSGKKVGKFKKIVVVFQGVTTLLYNLSWHH